MMTKQVRDKIKKLCWNVGMAAIMGVIICLNFYKTFSMPFYWVWLGIEILVFIMQCYTVKENWQEINELLSKITSILR